MIESVANWPVIYNPRPTNRLIRVLRIVLNKLMIKER